MGTHKHGLPTSLDDEVLVGLIQLTKRRSNFTDAKVQFSRYELIELLGWPQSGQSYRRIEEALHRWVGVVLMYENAWWDNAAKSWVDEQFHVLDNVTLYDRERWRTSARNGKAGQGGTRRLETEKPPLPLSSFRWNEVIFQSFQSGNLKQLDLEFYLKLRLPTTKRMYRFLDKRFYRRSPARLRLADAGLRAHRPEPILCADRAQAAAQAGPRGTGAARVPRAAQPRGALFLRQARHLADHPDPRGGAAPGGPEPRELAGNPPNWSKCPQGSRGHRPGPPRSWSRPTPAARIRTKIEVFDWLIRNEDKRVGKNPAGYLVASIRSDYQAPGDYQSRPAAAALALEQAQAYPARGSAEGRRRGPGPARQSPRGQAPGRLGAASPAEREAILAAVKAQNPGLSRWKNMLEPLCLAALETRLHQAKHGASQALLFPDAEG